MVRRKANVEIEVMITDKSTGKQQFTQTYMASNIDGSLVSVAVGVFASIEDLRVVTEKTLRDVVDKALDGPKLRVALQRSSL